MAEVALSERRLRLAGTCNVRDLGGYATENGGRTRWRTLLRGDCLHRLDPDGGAALAELGLRRVIDLRDEVERRAEPDRLDGLRARAAWHPLDVGALPPEETLGELYLALIERRGDRIAAAVADLCRPGGLPALVHCTAGKDRTGIVAGLVLSAAGVGDREVIADFTLTSRYVTASRLAEIRVRVTRAGLPQLARVHHVEARPEWMAAVLSAVRDRHGGAAGYLLDHGLTAAQLARLRSALVVGGTAA